MNLKKAISAISALAISVSCFAGLAITSHAADEVITLNPVASASWRANNKSDIAEQEVILNPAGTTTPADIIANQSGSSASSWVGHAIMEFTLPAFDPSRVKSATLQLSVKNTNGANRAYQLFKVKQTVDIVAATTDDEKTAIRDKIIAAVNGAAAISDQKGVNKNESQTDTISDDRLVDYIKEVASSENTTKFQIGDTNNAQPITILMTAGQTLTSGTSIVPTLTITLADASAQAVKYTVKYVDAEGNDVKDAVERDGFVGTEVSATADDKKDFESADGTKKYIYTAGGTETITPTATASENVITVKFTEVSKVAYSVTDPTTSTEIATGSDFVGNTVSVAYPRYIVKNNKLYMHGQQSANPWYGYAFDLDADAAKNVKELTYTEVTDKGTVAYFAEGEDITGFTKDTGGNSDIRCSMKASGNMTAGATVTVTTLPAGKYRLYAGVWGNAGGEFTFNAGSQSFHFKNDNPAVDGVAIKSAGWWLEYGADQDLTITEDTAVTVTKNDAANGRIDYIYIMKTGDLPVDVAAPTEVATAIAHTTPTGAVGTPEFSTIAEQLEGSKMIKFVVTNPLENVYPKVTIKGADYQLNADTVTAIPGANNTVSYYLEFKAKTEADLADFGIVTVSYGSGANTGSATFNFAAE